jgi:hypothetical protein
LKALGEFLSKQCTPNFTPEFIIQDASGCMPGQHVKVTLTDKMISRLTTYGMLSIPRLSFPIPNAMASTTISLVLRGACQDNTQKYLLSGFPRTFLQETPCRPSTSRPRSTPSQPHQYPRHSRMDSAVELSHHTRISSSPQKAPSSPRQASVSENARPQVYQAFSYERASRNDIPIYSTEHTTRKLQDEEKRYSHSQDDYTRSKRLGKKGWDGEGSVHVWDEASGRKISRFVLLSAFWLRWLWSCQTQAGVMGNIDALCHSMPSVVLRLYHFDLRLFMLKVWLSLLPQ